jgi:branched-chain amino acid transport system substrate-binding protein
VKHTRLYRWILALAGSASLVGLAAVGGGGQAMAAKSTINIGVSLSLTGDFSSDGQACEQGLMIWQQYVNSHGGLLGHPVHLVIVNDASSTSQVVTNYQNLINQDHVQFVFGPFSSLLNIPAGQVAQRYGYLFLEGNGGGPTVFQQHYTDLFDVSAPVANQLVTYAQWILSLPKAIRPKTAAYASQQDPFTLPQIQLAQKILQKGGVKTVLFTTFPDETVDYTPIALKIINSHAQMVIGGTLIDSAAAFLHDFYQQGYHPKTIAFTAGPDQGQQWLTTVGKKETEGVIVPIGWDPSLNTYQNHLMVQMYLKKYGGKAADISSDVAEEFAVGQVLQQLVATTKSLSNAVLIHYLRTHLSHVWNTVQGPIHFNALGESSAPAYLGQWIDGKLVFVYPPSVATAKPEYPIP